jgi:hypothetical protein
LAHLKYALSTLASGRTRQGSGRLTVARLLGVGWLALLLRLGGRCLERLLKVGDDIVNVLCTDRDADEVLVSSMSISRNLQVKKGGMGAYLGHTRTYLLFVTQLLVRSRPRMDSQRLRVTNICQI